MLIALAALIHFHLPAERLEEALLEFGRQSELTVLFNFNRVRDRHMITVPLEGYFSHREALCSLLKGTGVPFFQTDARTYSVDGKVSDGDDTACDPRLPTPAPQTSILRQAALRRPRVDSDASRPCVCAQTVHGEPLGPWCWEGEAIIYVPQFCPPESFGTGQRQP